MRRWCTPPPETGLAAPPKDRAFSLPWWREYVPILTPYGAVFPYQLEPPTPAYLAGEKLIQLEAGVGQTASGVVAGAGTVRALVAATAAMPEVMIPLGIGLLIAGVPAEAAGRAALGQTGGQVTLGTLGEISGLNGIISPFTKSDLAGWPVDHSPFEEGFGFSLGLGQLLGWTKAAQGVYSYLQGGFAGELGAAGGSGRAFYYKGRAWPVVKDAFPSEVIGRNPKAPLFYSVPNGNGGRVCVAIDEFGGETGESVRGLRSTCNGQRSGHDPERNACELVWTNRWERRCRVAG